MTPAIDASRPAANFTGFFYYIAATLSVVLNSEAAEGPRPAPHDLSVDGGILSIAGTITANPAPAFTSRPADSSSAIVLRSYSGYDCIYRENNGTHIQNVEGKRQRIELELQRGKNRLLAGGSLSSWKLDYFRSENTVAVKADLSETDLYVGYMRNAGCMSIGGTVRSNLMASGPGAGLNLAGNPLHYFNSSALDVNAFLSCGSRAFESRISYDNYSVASGSIQIKNDISENSRTAIADVNCNRFSVSTRYDIPAVKLENNLSLNIYKSDTSLPTNCFFSEVNGRGISAEPAIKARTLPCQPECAVSIERLNLDLFVLDNTSLPFATLHKNILHKSNGLLQLSFSKKAAASLFFENLYCSEGTGFLELSQFTSWGMLFELPDRYRITGTSFDFSNYGIKFRYGASLKKIIEAKIDLAVSCAHLKICITTEELIRYMGLLPVYRNITNHTFEKTYAVVYVGLHTSINLKNTTATFRAKQMVPIALNGRNDKVGDAENPGKRAYGGFRGELGLEWHKKKKP